VASIASLISFGSPFGSLDAFSITKSYEFNFQLKPPRDAVAKFYLFTDKSVVTAPFDFKGIPAPEKGR